MDVYDLSSNTWSSATAMPTPRGYLAAADANGFIYAFGGDNNGAVNSVEQYYPPVTIYTFIKK
jgi:N-acetylneuraminic acid mutarotase